MFASFSLRNSSMSAHIDASASDWLSTTEATLPGMTLVMPGIDVTLNSGRDGVRRTDDERLLDHVR